jgi:hypothetical protein
MTTRIQELIIQANFLRKDEKSIEKFAELIVKECAELFVDQKYMILNPHEPFANERVRALKEHDKDTVRKIKQHFGVKE